MVKIAFYNRKHRPEVTHYYEVEKLAKKMGLDYKKSINVTDNPELNSPFVNIYTKIITIPKSWLKKFHPTEILAAIAHELGHIKNQKKFLTEMLFATFTPLGFVLILTLIAEFFGLGYMTIFLPAP